MTYPECRQCRRKLPVKDQEAGFCSNPVACRKRLEARVNVAVGEMRVLPFTASQERAAYRSAPKMGDANQR